VKTGAKIVLGLLGAAVIGGTIAAVVSGDSPPKKLGGGNGKGNGNQQPQALERPGYTVLPNCGGIEVQLEAAALAYAREVTEDAAGPGWKKDVELQLYGPVCYSDPVKGLAVLKKSGGFLWRMLRAVLQAAIVSQKLAPSDAANTFAGSKQIFMEAGIPEAELIPTDL
jgi:hypothetical protein